MLSIAQKFEHGLISLFLGEKLGVIRAILFSYYDHLGSRHQAMLDTPET